MSLGPCSCARVPLEESDPGGPPVERPPLLPSSRPDTTTTTLSARHSSEHPFSPASSSSSSFVTVPPETSENVVTPNTPSTSAQAIMSSIVLVRLDQICHVCLGNEELTNIKDVTVVGNRSVEEAIRLYYNLQVKLPIAFPLLMIFCFVFPVHGFLAFLAHVTSLMPRGVCSYNSLNDDIFCFFLC